MIDLTIKACELKIEIRKFEFKKVDFYTNLNKFSTTDELNPWCTNFDWSFIEILLLNEFTAAYWTSFRESAPSPSKSTLLSTGGGGGVGMAVVEGDEFVEDTFPDNSTLLSAKNAAELLLLLLLLIGPGKDGDDDTDGDGGFT